METKRLARSTKNRMIGGVCGGIGEYLGIDPAWVRLVFVLIALGRGFGLGLYLILWIILPRQDMETPAATEATVRAGADEIAERARNAGSEVRGLWQNNPRQVGLAVGGALIILGGLALLETLQISWLWWLKWDTVWPVLLIVAGLILIFRRVKGA